MVKAPDDEVPRRAVPEAAEAEGDEAVGHAPDGAEATTAEWDVNVIADPRAERDVPALPKILQVTREVGPIEILGQIHAEEFGDTDGDVAVAGEIEQNAKRQHRQKYPTIEEPERGELRLLVIDQKGEVVGDRDFFGEADRDAAQAIGKVARHHPTAPGLERREELRVALDGAGHERREENREEQELDRMADRFTPAAHFEKIMDKFEGEKTDTQGRRAGHNFLSRVGELGGEATAQRLDRDANEEEGVFVKAEGQRAQNHRRETDPFLAG